MKPKNGDCLNRYPPFIDVALVSCSYSCEKNLDGKQCSHTCTVRGEREDPGCCYCSIYISIGPEEIGQMTNSIIEYNIVWVRRLSFEF